MDPEEIEYVLYPEYRLHDFEDGFRQMYEKAIEEEQSAFVRREALDAYYRNRARRLIDEGDIVRLRTPMNRHLRKKHKWLLPDRWYFVTKFWGNAREGIWLHIELLKPDGAHYAKRRYVPHSIRIIAFMMRSELHDAGLLDERYEIEKQRKEK